MVDNVKTILANDIQDIIKSPELSMLLLKTYSKLYLQGSAPRICERSQRRYYDQLKNTGIMKAELIEKIKNRTLTPAWKGNKYSPKVFRHISDLYIHDKEACELLESGVLKESDFTKLPDGYASKIKTHPDIIGEIEVIPDVKQAPQYKAKKKNNKK